jgi:hypothetical protein
MQWFGEPYPSLETPAPIFPMANEMPTPVGEPCLYCDEPIVMGDRGVVMPFVTGAALVTLRAQHYECFMRQILGSSNHIGHRCSCYGGTEGHGRGDLTRRAEALLALAELDRKRDRV